MTKKLYYADQYQRRFSSAVVEQTHREGKPVLILEETAFYPSSGGQPHDLGTLNGIRVLEVRENDDHQVLHLLEQPIEDAIVEGQIDWDRRFDHMQQHTGQHLLSQVFIKTCDAETISMHLGEEVSTVDVNHPDLTDEQVKTTEDLANRIIYEDRQVLTHFATKDDIYTFPLRKILAVEDNIRIIEIKDFDFSPCGGTHCRRTGEIGIIKVRKAENYKGGSRIQFVCGGRALRDYQQKTIIIRHLCEMFTAGEADLPQNIAKLQEESKTLRRDLAHLTQQLDEYEARALLTERKKSGDAYVLKKIFAGRDPKELKLLAIKVLDVSPNTVVLFGGKAAGKVSLIFLRSEDGPGDMNQLMKTACAVIHGRGGGQPHQAQGGGIEPEHLEEALQLAEKVLLEEWL